VIGYVALTRDFEKQYDTVELDEFKLLDVLTRIAEFNQKVWARGIIKMVLGLATRCWDPNGPLANGATSSATVLLRMKATDPRIG
jgi:hypothetical protein